MASGQSLMSWVTLGLFRGMGGVRRQNSEVGIQESGGCGKWGQTARGAGLWNADCKTGRKAGKKSGGGGRIFGNCPVRRSCPGVGDEQPTAVETRHRSRADLGPHEKLPGRVTGQFHRVIAREPITRYFLVRWLKQGFGFRSRDHSAARSRVRTIARSVSCDVSIGTGQASGTRITAGQPCHAAAGL
jgi:hypothetical protein